MSGPTVLHLPNGGMVTVNQGNTNGRFSGPDSQSAINLVTLISLLNTVTHILLGSVACCAFLFANLFISTHSTSQHIYLCVFGYVIMMGAGVLSICPYSGWTRILTYQQRKTAHGCMQVPGASFVVIGSVIRMLDQSSNFRTTHGILGFVAMIFTIITSFGGVIQYFMNMSRISKIIHFVCGSLTITVAFLSLIFAFDTVYRLVFGTPSANLLIAATVLALAGVLFSSSLNTFYRLN